MNCRGADQTLDKILNTFLDLWPRVFGIDLNHLTVNDKYTCIGKLQNLVTDYITSIFNFQINYFWSIRYCVALDLPSTSTYLCWIFCSV